MPCLWVSHITGTRARLLDNQATRRRRLKKGVHIIECLDDDDPGSEGRCLKHLFNLLEVASKYQRVRSIDDLIAAMHSSKYRYIHISTHGKIGKRDQFQGWWTPGGHGRKSMMDKLKGKLRCRLVISTACRSGTRGFGQYVVDHLGSKYFIGPEKSPSFASAVLFSHIIYHKIFITHRSLRKAFSSYEKGYKNPYDFKLYRREAA